ncbi:MAG: hypothetical protein Q8P27_01340 [Candidatus Peregrinibacteria bacterium]|nr:hypothetical protein [Candidatus Peregrinibacteria bacterium]
MPSGFRYIERIDAPYNVTDVVRGDEIVMDFRGSKKSFFVQSVRSMTDGTLNITVTDGGGLNRVINSGKPDGILRYPRQDLSLNPKLGDTVTFDLGTGLQTGEIIAYTNGNYGVEPPGKSMRLVKPAQIQPVATSAP